MKNIILILLLFLASCSAEPNPLKVEKIRTKVVITKIYYSSYSHVEGYIYYNNLPILVKSNGQNCCYKHFNLNLLDTIEKNVSLMYYNVGGDILIKSSYIDISDYE